MTLNNKKKITLTIATALLLVLCASQFAQAAAPPTPNYGSGITVDGDTSDWGLEADFYADMYRAGIDDANHPLESKLYLRYDPESNFLYVLILTVTERPVMMEEDEAWVKIDAVKAVDGSYPAELFAWVNPNSPSAGYAEGFEAKISLAQGDYTIDVHANVWNAIAQESETSRPLAILNITVVPEVAIGTTIVAVIAAAALFAVYKHKKQ